MAYEKGKPEPGIKAKLLDDRVRGNNDFIQPAINNEHNFVDADANNQSGDHTQGSARCFWTDTEPPTRIDGSTFASTDLGSLWVDTDDNAMYILTAITPTWTPISTQLYETLLAQQNTWADVQTFSKTPVLPTSGNGLTPVGSMMEFAGSSAPTGWLICNGQQLTEGDTDETYESLYGVIGTTYGGAGVSDFNVPDMRGRVPLGVGTGDASDATAHALADKEGTETHLLTHEESGLPAHKHDINYRSAFNSGSAQAILRGATIDGQLSSVIQDVTAADASATHNNLQPSLGLNYIIKY